MRFLRTDFGLGRVTTPWRTAVLAGVLVPVFIVLVLSPRPASLALATGPILTLGLMGVGIIGAATAGRFWLCLVLALANAACLLMLALALGTPASLPLFSISFAMVVASASFTARGFLFSRNLGARGWWMALFVVAGEASVLLIAAVWPGVLPNWFLALLPAQWASIAIRGALLGVGSVAVMPVLIALGGTAATTLLAARLWQHRWPYLLMFTAWLALSALVYFRSAPTLSPY